MKRLLQGAAFFLLLSTLNSQLSTAHAQGTAFTYQGRLMDGVSAANGIYDLRFSIYDSTNSPGTLVAGPMTNSATAVSNGLFTVTLDFGNQFPGTARWLEIAVRTNGATSFFTLNPRQPLTPAPYAITAGNVTGTVAAGQVTGPLALGQLPGVVVTNGASGVSISGNFSGNGANVTNVNVGTLYAPGILSWGNFFLAASPGAGFGPVSVTAVDVNGDGKVDLLCANEFGNTVSVLTNNGSGGFVLTSSPIVGTTPFSVAAADINGDGKVDAISANANNNTLSVLTNNGSGVFGSNATLNVGGSPRSVVAVDVNGDGKMDLVCANYGSNTLSVLTNNGSGGFVLAATLAVGNSPSSVTTTDINGDGKADLISANSGDTTVSVLTNNGSGVFGVNATLNLGSAPEFAVAADVNGDGKPDLISANEAADTVSVWTNSGSGVFGSNATVNVGSSFPRTVVVADVNGDGKPDLITANISGNTLSVLTNNGTGGFVLAAVLGVTGAPAWVTAADVNGDGRVDLISANITASTVSVLLNTPFFTGSFTGNGAGLTGVLPASGSTNYIQNQTTVNQAAAFRISGNGIFNGGSVGVGVAIPQQQLSVAAGMNIDQNDANSGTIGNALTFGSVSGEGIASKRTAGGNQFGLDFYASGVNRLSIVNSGNVGINTNNPLATLGVNGNTRLDAAGQPYNEGLALNFPTNMNANGGYGGIHFHSTGQNSVFDANSIKWGIFYNYAPPSGIFGNGLSFVQNNATTRLYISTNGNVGIGTLSPTNKLHVVGGATFTSGAGGANQSVIWIPGSASWSFTSDRNTKDRIQPVDPQSVLEKVSRLPIAEWSYIGYDQRHIGPMAQDFHEQFPLNGSDKALNDADLHGVALAAIQGLNEKVQEKDARIKELEARLDKLEQLVNSKIGGAK